MKKRILALLLCLAMLLPASVLAAETATDTSKTTTTTTDTSKTTTDTSKTTTDTSKTTTDTSKTTADTSATGDAAAADTEAEESKPAFSDVSADDVHFDAIRFLTENEIIEGYTDGTFKSENVITRAEFVKMLVVFGGWNDIQTSSDKTGFSDVDPKGTKEDTAHWALHYIKIAVDQGIVNGMGDGTFHPDDPVKYEEAVKMLVCYLGYETAAKSDAELAKKDLWPDGYLLRGNKLLISKNASCSVGDGAPRGIVAQMIYNIKDEKRITTLGQNVIASVPSISGGGGGGGGDGKTYTTWEKIENGMNVSGAKVTGKIVAAVRVTKDGKYTYYYIDDAAPRSNFGQYKLIIKCDRVMQGSSYVMFDAGKSDYSGLLGYDVKVDFNYYDDAFSINKLEYGTDYNKTQTINGSQINKTRTLEKIAATGQNYLVYKNSDGNFEDIKIPDDFSTAHVMYNHMLAGDETIETDDGNGGTVSTPTSVTINDLIHDNGSITLVTNASSGKKFGNGEYDVITVECYDTYVTKESITSGSPRVLTDKYKKDANGDPIKLQIYEKGENGTQLEVVNANSTSSTTDYKLDSISKGNVLSVSRSLGGMYTRVEYTNKNTSKLVVSDFNDSTLYLGSGNTEYTLSNYYKDYVASTIEIEKDKQVTAYLDTAGEIVWLDIAALSYNLGYIVKSSYSYDDLGTDSAFTIQFMTPGATKFTERTVTKTTKFNGVTCSNLSDPTLDSGLKYVYNSLIANAAIINAGKSVSSNEANSNSARYTCQPFMYTDNGTNFTNIKIINVDEANRLTNANRKKLLYDSSETAFMDGNNKKYPISNTTTLIFVPDNRTGYSASQGYTMGTRTQVSSRLKDYQFYYVEPFFTETTNSDGSTSLGRNVYVLYYQSIDSNASYYSDNIIVKSLDQTTASTSSYQMTAYPGTYTTGSGTYTIYRSSTVPLEDSLLAYVLDSSYNRMKDSAGKYVKRKIEEGDVIRFGLLPDGKVINMEIIFDISENIENRKYGIYNVSGNRMTLDYDYSIKSSIRYFARLGLFSGEIDDSTSDIDLNLIYNDGVEYGEDKTYETFNIADRSVYSYNFKYDDKDKFGKGATKISEIDPKTDMVFILQKASSNKSSLSMQYIYVVRYDEDMQQKYAELVNPLSLISVPETADVNELPAEVEETPAEEPAAEAAEEITDEPEITEEPEETESLPMAEQPAAETTDTPTDDLLTEMPEQQPAA